MKKKSLYQRAISRFRFIKKYLDKKYKTEYERIEDFKKEKIEEENIENKINTLKEEVESAKKAKQMAKELKDKELKDKELKDKDNKGDEGSFNGAKQQPHLTIGSPEYEEWIRDKEGISELRGEQIKKLESAKIKDIASEEKIKDELSKYEEFNENFAKGEVLEHIKPTPEEVRRMKRKSKERQIDDILEEAEKLAKKTETLKDDEYVENKMKEDLYEYSKDNNVSEDEYLPKALRKYL